MTMRSRTVARVAVVAIAALGLTAASAQQTGSRRTREFVQAAGQSDQFEILEAQTVLTQSQDAQVRSFAQQMIRDHGQTGSALRDATARAGIQPPPPGISPDQGQMLGALQSVRGPDVDKTYWRQQALSHRSALLVAQRYAADGDTPAVKQAAAAAVPMISSHLAMAEQMAARLGGS